MLRELFLTVAGISWQTSLVILVVLLVRLLLRKLGAPTAVSYALWAVVLFRLLCPVSLEGGVGVIPAEMAEKPREVIIKDYAHIPAETVLYAPIGVLGDALNGGVDGMDFSYDSEAYGQEGYGRIFPGDLFVIYLGALWPAGVVGLVVYSAVSYVKLRRKLIGAVPLEGNIRLADHIASPFVMGLFRPKIYLPSNLSEHEREYIILHERHHIRRGDHIIKLLAFAALCIHWFNPLVWLAFFLSGRDMEMSCDEAVIKNLGEDIRADYSASLLSLATGRRILAAMPLAFGEGDTKGRIRNLAKWKKPAVWITVLAVVLCAAVIVLCATNAKDSRQTAAEDSQPGQQTEEQEPNQPPRKYGPDRAYVSEKCLYMAPYSSYYPAGGNSGYRYLMGDSGVYKVNRSNGDKTVLAEGGDWEQWGDLPWSMQEWEDLFWFGGGDMVRLDGAVERAYCPLSETECLLRVDGVLWLVELRGGQSAGKHIHSIYTLVPEGAKGGAQWEFAPMLSSREPYFRFEFDMEYDEISAACAETPLMDRYESGALEGEKKTTTVLGEVLRFQPGHAVYWSPGEGAIPVYQSEIRFTGHKDGQTVCSGTVYIRGNRIEESGTVLYTATLVGTGLVMEQNSDGGGAVIRMK